MFNESIMSAALDEGTYRSIHEVMERMQPQQPYLTFDHPAVAARLSMYGSTTMGVEPYTYPSIPAGVYGAQVTPYDSVGFPPKSFGFIHMRWPRLDDGNTVRNALRWLMEGGVLMVEQPDAYPARSLAYGSYRSVVGMVLARAGFSVMTDLPGSLMRSGLKEVGCRHERLSTDPFHVMLQSLIEHYAPWDVVRQEDLKEWPIDGESSEPGIVNIVSWGLKRTVDHNRYIER